MSKPTLSQLALALCVVGAVMLYTTWPGAAHPTDAIIVTGEDSLRDVIPAPSSTLNTFLSEVAPRPVMQFSESLRYITLTANLPPAFETLLNGVDDHIQIQFAQSNRIVTSLVYPDAIIDDSTAPQVTAIAATPTGDGSTALITWTTNEFANSTVLYGTQSGNLNQTVSEALYNKNHSVTLTGLVPDTTYYFKVQSEDLEGNLTESTQSSFVAEATRYIYLPVITR